MRREQASPQSSGTRLTEELTVPVELVHVSSRRCVHDAFQRRSPHRDDMPITPDPITAAARIASHMRETPLWCVPEHPEDGFGFWAAQGRR